MEISSKDIEILRALAAKYMEYAVSPANIEKERLWKKLNALSPERPMVAMDQLPWHEMNFDGSLNCKVENPYFRGIENGLRMEIFKWEHLPADMVLTPYIILNRPWGSTGYGLGAQVERIGLAQRFTDLLTEEEDVQKIKDPVVTIDRAAEKDITETAAYIFDGIAPLKMGGYQAHCGVWDTISMWKGVENCYIDIMDRPEFVHAIMTRITEALISQIEQCNALGIYDVSHNTCHCSYICSDSWPASDCNFDAPKSYDGWAMGLAQLFSSVSPEITREFEVPYMQKVFPYFKNVYYGCCDRLDDRLDLIDLLPNVRKVSCSPWSDRENFARRLPHKYIMSNKPNPAFLAESVFDEDGIRADLRRTINAARENGVALEMILKDVSTIQNDVSRLERWSEIAVEEACR